MIEKMAEFFDARVEGYEEHMLTNIVGAEEYYRETALVVPVIENMRLLDLGCGTGLELDRLFPLNPSLRVTGVDMAGKMLEMLRQKYPDKAMTLIQGDYFTVELPEDHFDAAVAVQTMHHFRDDEKIRLYRRILGFLKPGGMYIETDYTAVDEAEEERMLSEADRLLREGGEKNILYHIDIPFTSEHQARLLTEAGFREVQVVWHKANTAIMTARK